MIRMAVRPSILFMNLMTAVDDAVLDRMGEGGERGWNSQVVREILVRSYLGGKSSSKEQRKRRWNEIRNLYQ